MKRIINQYSTNALKSPILRDDIKTAHDLEMGSLHTEISSNAFILPSDLMNLVLAYLDDEDLMIIVIDHRGDSLIKNGLPYLNEDTLLYVKECCYIKPAIKHIDSYILKNILFEELRHPIQTKRPLAYFLILNFILISTGIVFTSILYSWVIFLSNEQRRMISLAQNTYEQIQKNCTGIFLVNNEHCTVIPYDDVQFQYKGHGVKWRNSNNQLTCGEWDCLRINHFLDCNSLSDLRDEPAKNFDWREDASSNQLYDKHSEYCARSIFNRISICSSSLASTYQDRCDSSIHSRNASIATNVIATLVAMALLGMIFFVLNRYYNFRRKTLLNRIPASELPLEGHVEVAWLINERIRVENKTLGQVFDKLELMKDDSDQHIARPRSVISKIGFFRFLNEPSKASLGTLIPSRL